MWRWVLRKDLKKMKLALFRSGDKAFQVEERIVQSPEVGYCLSCLRTSKSFTTSKIKSHWRVLSRFLYVPTISLWLLCGYILSIGQCRVEETCRKLLWKSKREMLVTCKRMMAIGWWTVVRLWSQDQWDFLWSRYGVWGKKRKARNITKVFNLNHWKWGYC